MDQIAQPEVDLPPWTPLHEFRELVYKDAPIDPAAHLVCRDFGGCQLEVKATTLSDEFEFVASTESVDRDQDTMRAKGFDLRAYRRSPVWLAFHDPREWIGVSVHVEVEDDKFFNTLKLGPGKMAQFVKEMIEFRLQTKALKDAGASCSVGYLPTKVERAPRDSGRPFGLDFIKQELLETSHVPIGSNREALLRAKAAGVDHSAAGEWAERYRNLDSGVLVSIETAEAIVKALDPSKGMKLFQMKPSEIWKGDPEATTLDPTPDASPSKTAAKDEPSDGIRDLAKCQGEMIKTIESLVEVIRDQNEVQKSALAPDADERDPAAVEAAIEKFKADHFRQEIREEFTRRTGAIPE